MQYLLLFQLCNHLAEEAGTGCLLQLFSCFLMAVSRIFFFLPVPSVGLWCMIVVFPSHTYYSSA